MNKIPLVLAAWAATLFVTAPAISQSAVTYSPLTGIGVGPNGPAGAKIKTEPYCCPSTALLVKASQPVAESDFQWINFGLTMPGSPSGRRITAVQVCYEIHAPVPDTTYISQTRLTDMTTPNAAHVILDDPTKRIASGPTCYTVRRTAVSRGTVSLALKVVIASPQDEIRIGMVRLVL